MLFMIAQGKPLLIIADAISNNYLYLIQYNILIIIIIIICYSTSRSNNSIIVSPSPPQLDDDDSSQPPVKKKRSCDEFDDALIRHLQEKAEARKKRQEETEDDHFSRHVAGVLKRLPSRAKAIARLRIEQVLLDVEFPEPQSFQTPYNFPS